jgi:hypothetical protein
MTNGENTGQPHQGGRDGNCDQKVDEKSVTEQCPILPGRHRKCQALLFQESYTDPIGRGA